MKEEWKQIEGFSRYYVSNTGKIKSFSKSKKGKLLVQVPDKDGYYRVLLYYDKPLTTHKNNGNNRIPKRVNRLVAQAFIPNPNNYPIINHKDENKQNNNVDNLEWCSYQYNVVYGNALEKFLKTKRKANCKFGGVDVYAYKMVNTKSLKAMQKLLEH